jgi:hypothetical protein
VSETELAHDRISKIHWHRFQVWTLLECIRICELQDKPMMLIATFIQRVWRRGQKANETDAARRFSDSRDRSSMADFVRILQAHDHQQTGGNSA